MCFIAIHERRETPSAFATAIGSATRIRLWATEVSPATICRVSDQIDRVVTKLRAKEGAMARPRISGRRDRILDAAALLILEHGFSGMTMSGLAMRVGIGKGALYLEFAGKSEIVDHLLARSTTRALAVVDLRLAPGRGLGELYRVVAEALLDDELLTAAYLDDSGVLGDYVASRSVDDRYRRRLEAFSAYIELLHRRGDLDPDLDPEPLALALAAFTVGLLSLAKIVGPIRREVLGDTIRTIGTIVDRGVVRIPVDDSVAEASENSSLYRGMVEQILADNTRTPPGGDPPIRRRKP